MGLYNRYKLKEKMPKIAESKWVSLVLFQHELSGVMGPYLEVNS